MRYLKGYIIFSLLFLISGNFFGIPPQKGAANASYTAIEGLHMVDFLTPHGKIHVNLPDDMAMGDIISGTLVLEPLGQKEKAKSKSLKKLQSYTLQIGEQKTTAGSGWGKWNIPGVKKLSIILENPQGKVVARIQIPVLPEAPARGKEGYQCPKIVIAGTIFQYFGEFNGDFSDTDGHIGDREVKKWSESPRSLVLDSPKDILGRITLNLKEGDVQDTCQYRNITIQAAAGKHRLLKGESTTLTVIVRGLEGLDEKLPLNIENKTPGIVSMKGEGTFFIQPGDVQPGGVFITTRTLTGKSPGDFHISATLPTEPASSTPDKNQDKNF